MSNVQPPTAFESSPSLSVQAPYQLSRPTGPGYADLRFHEHVNRVECGRLGGLPIVQGRWWLCRLPWRAWQGFGPQGNVTLDPTYTLEKLPRP